MNHVIPLREKLNKTTASFLIKKYTIKFLLTSNITMSSKHTFEIKNQDETTKTTTQPTVVTLTTTDGTNLTTMTTHIHPNNAKTMFVGKVINGGNFSVTF